MIDTDLRVPVTVTLDKEHNTYEFYELDAMINGEYDQYRAVETKIEGISGYAKTASMVTNFGAKIGAMTAVNTPEFTETESLMYTYQRMLSAAAMAGMGVMITRRR